jgi:hypothetical protein
LCELDLTLARGLAVYQGVELFGEFADDASTSKFPQWQIKVRIARDMLFWLDMTLECPAEGGWTVATDDRM